MRRPRSTGPPSGSVQADHPAAGQAGPHRRRAVPHAGRAAHLRPAGDPHRRRRWHGHATTSCRSWSIDQSGRLQQRLRAVDDRPSSSSSWWPSSSSSSWRERGPNPTRHPRRRASEGKARRDGLTCATTTAHGSARAGHRRADSEIQSRATAGQRSAPTPESASYHHLGSRSRYWMIITRSATSDTPSRRRRGRHRHLDNYVTAFSTDLGNHFGRALLNSVVIGVVVTVFALLCRRLRGLRARPAGVQGQVPRARVHPGRLDVPGRRPSDPAVPAVHRHRLAIGTYQALIIPDISFVLPLTIYTLTAFFGEMPWELEEAARIDGCTPGRRSARSSCRWPPRAVHHRDPGLHRGLERVPARQPVLDDSATGHRRDRLVRRAHRTRSRTPPSWRLAPSSPFR